MARPIVLGNGEMHVGINMFGMVHDFYYPYVGLENHSAGPKLRHHVGVWVNGKINWLDSGQWHFEFDYQEDALVGVTRATNRDIGVQIDFKDCVDHKFSVFLRDIKVTNLTNDPMSLRLFMHQAFAIGDSRSNTDTAQYLPDSDAILHYRGRRAFVVSGSSQGEPFDQHSIGLFGIEGREGTYKDAEDGELDSGDAEHGRVDSTIRFCLDLGPNSSKNIEYWISAGRTIRDALDIHKMIQDDGLDARLQATADWWREWLQPASEYASQLPTEYSQTFLRSLMIIKSHADSHGAVIASTDTTLLNYDRDAYAYSWPRDGAYVVWPLIRMGYKNEAKRFFEFCKEGLHGSGYLSHKYRADGAVGSSWHPYIHDGVHAPPIQEDETALVLVVFAELYKLDPNEALLDEFYEDMVVPMADFMAEYIDQETGLPRPTYDLWEEAFATNTYTVATVHAALIAASELAIEAQDHNHAVTWRTAADEIKIAAKKHLYNPDRQIFYKNILLKDGELQKDTVIDSSSVFGAYMFGLFDPDSQEVKSSVDTLQEVFAQNYPVGIPRYENDVYRRSSKVAPSNRWFITSLWLAQYMLANNQTDKAVEIIDWVLNSSLNTGVMGEQLDQSNGELVSPAPLVWSHAEYLSTMLDLINVSKGKQ